MRFMVAIETDATRYHGENASRPRLLEHSETAQILAHLSTDLAVHFPQLKSCSIGLAGALYDQTQLLRPGYPIYSTLEARVHSDIGSGSTEPAKVALGAKSDGFPAALQPDQNIPLGILQTLPLVCGGDDALIEELADAMEHRFLESGQISAHSAKALEANFEIAVNHARFMTVTDLNAMLHLQLEHFGFLPLWQLLDAAINVPDTELSVEGSGSQQFHWTGTAVRCSFETFDYWANQGSGKSLAASGLLLATSYSEWTREYRQYLTTLAAHEVPLEQVLASDPSAVLNSSFLIEDSGLQPRKDSVQLTEHSSGELGTVAVSVIGESGLMNYYPLIPSGLNDLHASIRKELGISGAVSFPGGVLYDEASRMLRPDNLNS